MIAIAYYLLKVIICSGILFWYYHIALRNKIFHQWNRFYLLAAVVLSLSLPLLQFTFIHSHQEPNRAIQLLRVVQSADDYMEEIYIRQHQAMTMEQWLGLAYLAVSVIVLATVIVSVVKIYFIIKTHRVQRVNQIKFISTQEQGTPFSFFRYIFWNDKIDIHSSTGQQIFQHELVHVKEAHTFDKLFLQLTLILFWCNPFFWLIRRELQMIHEFIADKKAVQQHDTATLAAMILQASYPHQFSNITNPFFQSSIKRRLLMLTKIQNPRISYASRILALPLIAFTVLAFSFRTKIERYAASAQSNTSLTTDTIPQGVVPDDIIINGYDKISKTDKELIVINGIIVNPETLRGKVIRSNTIGVYQKNDPQAVRLYGQAAVNGVLIFEDATIDDVKNMKRFPERTIVGVKATSVKNTGTNDTLPKNSATVTIKNRKEEPLYFVDGKEFNDDVNKINSNSIQSITVLKDQSAIAKYGERGKNGVIEIHTKSTHTEYKDTVPKTDPIFSKTEIEASIDKKEWREFLEKNLQPIIENAASKGMPTGQYTVNLKFIVKKDGSLTDFKALNDPGYGLAQNVLEIMPKSPKWKPARQNGKPVNSYHTQPITFVISDGSEPDKNHSSVTDVSELQSKNVHDLIRASKDDEIVSFEMNLEKKDSWVTVSYHKGNSYTASDKEVMQAIPQANRLSIWKILVRRNGKEKKLNNIVYEL